MSFSLTDFVIESNRIEGILRDPFKFEIGASESFLKLPYTTVADLERYVFFIQPGAKLRKRYGMNVQVGRHVPISGGPIVEIQLTNLLDDINYQKALGSSSMYCYTNHVRYETLHPFMDGNGRSGRILWLWQMGGIEKAPLGFLHTFYYQTLDLSRKV